MLVTFKSAATGDLVMLGKSGKEILALLGKDPEALCGIITVEQLPGAIEALQTAISSDKARQGKQPAEENETEKNGGREINLYQRALPLLEMLERASQERKPATWGV